MAGSQDRTNLIFYHTLGSSEMDVEKFNNQFTMKKEFADNATQNRDNSQYLEPHQRFLRNYIAKQTLYDSVLVFHGLGTGKTCSAISIAEGFKEYVYNLGRNIVVMTKNKSIERNFKNELLSQCTSSEYLSDEDRLFLNDPKVSKDAKKRILNKTSKEISKYYRFITYGSFVNRVLGAKQYEKDMFGATTGTVKKRDGKEVRSVSKDAITDFNNTVIIIDEVHNITNTDTYTALMKVISNSYNVRLVLLTATPLFDNPKEIFELTNLLSMKSLVPVRNDLLKTDPPMIEKVRSDFIHPAIVKGGVSRVTEVGSELLKKTLRGKVSYLTLNPETFPKRIDEGVPVISDRKGSTHVVLCEMSDYQYQVYSMAVQQDIGEMKDVNIDGLLEEDKPDFDVPSSPREVDGDTQADTLEQKVNTSQNTVSQKISSLYKNSSDASTMVYPDELYGKEGFMSSFRKPSGLSSFVPKSSDFLNAKKELRKYSSKLFALLSNISDSQGSVFVFSHYVNFGGTTLIGALLKANGYSDYRTSRSSTSNDSKGSYVIFDDKLTAEQKEKLRKTFNSPANKDGSIIKIIVGSPVMSEGITLKNVRQVHILEPYWNLSRVEQVIGRAIRNYSHHDLPEEQRTVQVFKYVSMYTGSGKLENNFFIDKEKYILSEEKDRNNKRIERLLKRIAIDCELNHERNIFPPEHDFSSQCDYEECSFTCDVSFKGKNRALDTSTYDLYIGTIEKQRLDYVSQLIERMFRKQFVWRQDDITSFIRKMHPFVAKEVMFVALDSFLTNRTTVQDRFDREGYIIKRGPFFIFNANDINVKSSLFAKVLDFSKFVNASSLNTMFKKRYNIDITAILEDKSQETPKDASEAANVLSQSDIAFNEAIIKESDIYGSFYGRPPKSSSALDNPFGLKDDKFRIVDKRNESNNPKDRRKIMTGMVCRSYSKGDLINLVELLQIQYDGNLVNLDKIKLCELIEEYFRSTSRLLR